MSSQIDFGPLAGLIGTWQGSKGTDIAPESDGTETNPYSETLTFTAVGDVKNAESQVLVVVRYLQEVIHSVGGHKIHDETGYWMWDAATQEIMHSFVIPRGVSILAGGQYTKGENTCKLEVKSASDCPKWGIVQSPFMQEKAKTKSFERTLIVDGDKLSYSQTMVLDIYGRQFDHTDSNELTRVC